MECPAGTYVNVRDVHMLEDIQQQAMRFINHRAKRGGSLLRGVRSEEERSLSDPHGRGKALLSLVKRPQSRRGLA